MAVDEELLKDLRALSRRNPGLRELNTVESAEVAGDVRLRFVGEDASVWWWESLVSDSVTLPYGDSDGLQWLERLVPNRELVRLVVTDDEARPWRIFEGEAQELWRLLRELRYFEFFVTSTRCDWVIFDTHHNTLVVTGALLERAQSFGGSSGEDSGLT